jgi:hypothetical protein
VICARFTRIYQESKADANHSSNKFLIFMTLDRPRRQDFSELQGFPCA